MSVISPETFRAQFPGLERTVHLASCSQGALFRELAGDLLDFQSSIVEHGAPWDLWMIKVEQARALFAEFIGASPDEIAVVSSATEAAYHVASTQVYSERAAIVTTDLEFPSVGHVWLAQAARGARTVHVPERSGVVDPEDYEAAIDERTKLVSVPLVTYRNGARLPGTEVIALAKSPRSKDLRRCLSGGRGRADQRSPTRLRLLGQWLIEVHAGHCRHSLPVRPRRPRG